MLILRRIHYCIGACLLTNTAFALDESKTNQIIALSVGPAWYQAGQTQTLYLQSDYANTYHANTLSHALVSGELFFGLSHAFQQSIGQLGLALTTTNSAQLKGEVWETGDSQFNNYAYTYHIKHQDIAIKGKWLFSSWKQHFFPYLSASLGIARNTAYHFTQTPLIYEALPIANFQNRTLTALTYTIGAGIDKQFSTHWRLGVGYQLNAWGKSELAPTPKQTTSNGVSLSNIYTQQLQFTATCLL